MSKHIMRKLLLNCNSPVLGTGGGPGKSHCPNSESPLTSLSCSQAWDLPVLDYSQGQLDQRPEPRQRAQLAPQWQGRVSRVATSGQAEAARCHPTSEAEWQHGVGIFSMVTLWATDRERWIKWSGDFLVGPVVENLLCPVGVILDQGAKFPQAATTEADTTQRESACAATGRLHVRQQTRCVMTKADTRPRQC